MSAVSAGGLSSHGGSTGFQRRVKVSFESRAAAGEAVAPPCKRGVAESSLTHLRAF